MNSKQHKTILGLGALLLIGLIVVGGCKESEPEGPTSTAPEVKDVAAAAGEQTECPIMGGAIDKNLFVEYKGKKVYFCCAGCKDKFNEEPEKYLAKLPQFQQ